MLDFFDINMHGTLVEFFLNPAGYFLGFFEPYYPLLPSITLLLGALILLCYPKRYAFSTLITLLVSFVALLFSLIADPSVDRSYFNNMLVWNYRASLAQSFILFALCMSLLSGFSLAKRADKLTTEYYLLTLFVAIGGIQMAMSYNFIALFLAIELLSLPLYVLCAFRHEDNRSREAGFKYFMLGSFSAGLFLMGMTYLYGATGSFSFSELSLHAHTSLFLIGGTFLLASLAFKAALFPFHNWLPDVYEGAPAPVSGFMSSAVKMAIFAVLIKIFYEARLFADIVWQQPLQWFIIISMTVANLAAIKQKSFKRMLAYSSIAHVAYAFIGLFAAASSMNGMGIRAVLFYVITYGITSLGTFAVISNLDKDEKSPFYFEKLNGLFQTCPFIAISLALMLTSLASIPPASGFIGKFYLFSSAIDAGHWNLVIAGIINSLISMYYYARPVVNMFMQPAGTATLGSTTELDSISLTSKIVIGVSLFLTLLYGLMPSLLYRLTGSM